MLNLANQKLHREAANERQRRYAENHREKLKLKNREWERNNPDKVAARAARRRAARCRQLPTWADHEAIGMIYRAAEICRISGFDAHVDHIVPLQGKVASGLHVHHNLRIITAKANRSKANRLTGA